MIYHRSGNVCQHIGEFNSEQSVMAGSAFKKTPVIKKKSVRVRGNWNKRSVKERGSILSPQVIYINQKQELFRDKTK